MSISHRTNRLKLVGTPEVEQLQNGRYELTVNCTTINRREDWYSANKSRIFPDFGSLQSAEMSIDGLAPRTGEAYADMRLISVQSIARGEVYIVTLVYQTIGATFVQVKDDNVVLQENGLRRVSRTSIAQAGTDIPADDKDIGVDFIDHQIDTETTVKCFLSSYDIDDTDSYREFTRTYDQEGILNATREFKTDGMLYVTFYSQGSKFTPTALNPAKVLTDIVTEAFQGGAAAPVLISKVEDVNGYRKFEVTVMLFQDGSPLLANGTDNLVQSYQRYEKYERPGRFLLATDAITSSPGNTRDVLVDVTELISTDSDLAASYKPFSVTNWTNYNYRYIPSSTGQVVVKNGAADGYLGSGSFAASGGQVFGVDVDGAAGTAGSTPSPSAFNALENQVISSSVEPAFTTDEGVKWYRKIKVQMVGSMEANLGSV